MTAAEFAARVDPRRSGDGWVRHCPAHDGHSPSLWIQDGRDCCILMKCFAGCDTRDVIAALGMSMRDFGDVGAGDGKTIEATYDYVGEDGRLLFQVVRFEPKDFRQQHPCPNGDMGCATTTYRADPDGRRWYWNLRGVRRLLYHLPAVLAAVRP